MRYISLFAGVGGLDRAIDALGGEPLVQVENAEYPRAILDLRWPDVPKHEDVRTFRPFTFTGEWLLDLVVGGPPCQPVSHAGKRRGDDDERWLWGEALRVVEEAMPAMVFFENPMGIRTLGLDGILHRLDALGYGGAWEVVAAADVGAPHLRKRIFIMGIRGRRGWEGPTRPPGNRKVLWPSPNASGERPNEGNVRLLRQRVLDGTMSEDEAKGMLNGKSPFDAQGKVPALIPTPTARLGMQCGPQAKRYFDPARSNDPDDYVAAYPEPERSWPTPRAAGKGVGPLGSKSHEYRLAKGYLDATVQEAEQRTGQLNPDWVEHYLMGWPLHWTDINVPNGDLGPVVDWTQPEPNIPRVARGIENRTKRLTAIGNGVVTAQAIFAWQRLSERLDL